MFSLHKQIFAFPTHAKAKTRPPNKKLARRGNNAFTNKKASSQIRKRFYRAMRNRVDRANMRFPNENVFSKRKRRSKSLIRFYRTKTLLAQANTRLPSEKCVNRAKTSNANAKTRFPSRNVAQYTHFRHCEESLRSVMEFSLDKRISPLQTLFSQLKSVFAFAIDVFDRYSVIALRATFSLGKGFFAFQSYVFARGTRFRSVNAFSLGKRFFAFPCIVFYR